MTEIEDVLEEYNGLIGNWNIEAIISEIENSWDREVMADLLRLSGSLITTIESQKEEIEKLNQSAQSEGEARMRKELDGLYKQYSKDGECISKLWADNERLKEVASVIVTITDDYWNDEDGIDPHASMSDIKHFVDRLRELLTPTPEKVEGDM